MSRLALSTIVKTPTVDNQNIKNNNGEWDGSRERDSVLDLKRMNRYLLLRGASSLGSRDGSEPVRKESWLKLHQVGRLPMGSYVLWVFNKILASKCRFDNVMGVCQ